MIFKPELRAYSARLANESNRFVSISGFHNRYCNTELSAINYSKRRYISEVSVSYGRGQEHSKHVTSVLCNVVIASSKVGELNKQQTNEHLLICFVLRKVQIMLPTYFV